MADEGTAPNVASKQPPESRLLFTCGSSSAKSEGRCEGRLDTWQWRHATRPGTLSRSHRDDAGCLHKFDRSGASRKTSKRKLETEGATAASEGRRRKLVEVSKWQVRDFSSATRVSMAAEKSQSKHQLGACQWWPRRTRPSVVPGFQEEDGGPDKIHSEEDSDERGRDSDSDCIPQLD